MQLGIFAKTFNRPALPEVLEAVRTYGFKSLQFNMACAGLKSMPEDIPEGLPLQIAALLAEKQLKMAALSGTFNMIHPDKTQRRQGLKSLELLIQQAKTMGTANITLCTGSFDAQDMWRFHPDNRSEKAWTTLCRTLEQALPAAEAADVYLLVEPELANVVHSAVKARRLIDEMKSRRLRIVFDPANLLEAASPREMEHEIGAGLDVLGEYIEIAHAKDRNADGSFTAAGSGVLPFPFFFKKLKAIGFDGDVITHGLSESEVGACSAFLHRQMDLLR